MSALRSHNLCYLPQETNEIVAIKKFKDSEGKMSVNWMKHAFVHRAHERLMAISLSCSRSGMMCAKKL